MNKDKLKRANELSKEIDRLQTLLPLQVFKFENLAEDYAFDISFIDPASGKEYFIIEKRFIPEKEYNALIESISINIKDEYRKLEEEFKNI